MPMGTAPLWTSELLVAHAAAHCLGKQGFYFTLYASKNDYKTSTVCDV